jgi:hypothetical protein
MYGPRWVSDLARALGEPVLNIQRYKDRTRSVPKTLLPRVESLMARQETRIAKTRTKIAVALGL